ncbi:Molybdate-binding periplasmic protein precursor, partial [Haemophilus influenzae]
KMK